MQDCKYNRNVRGDQSNVGTGTGSGTGWVHESGLDHGATFSICTTSSVEVRDGSHERAFENSVSNEGSKVEAISSPLEV